MIKILVLTFIIGSLYLGYQMLRNDNPAEEYADTEEPLTNSRNHESRSYNTSSDEVQKDDLIIQSNTHQDGNSAELYESNLSEDIHSESIVDAEATANLNSQTAETYFIDLSSVENEVGMQDQKSASEPKSLLVDLDSGENKSEDKNTGEAASKEKEASPKIEIASEPEAIKFSDDSTKE